MKKSAWVPVPNLKVRMIERNEVDWTISVNGRDRVPGVRHLVILAAVTLAAINRSLSQCTRFQGHLGGKGGHFLNKAAEAIDK